MQKKGFGASGRNNAPIHQITTKNCHGQKIMTNRGHLFVRLFYYSQPQSPFLFHMDQEGNRHISEGEKIYGNPTQHLWGKAARTWKKELTDLTPKELVSAVAIANAMMKDPFVGYPTHIKSELNRKRKTTPVLSIDRNAEAAKLGDLKALKEIGLKIKETDSSM